MALNIKNEHVHTLAREAARRTGLTQTSVLERALEEFLARLPDAEDADELRIRERRAKVDEVLREMHALIGDEDRAAVKRFMEEMYDDHGLPR
ncbi:type II toxin-antitoxin system VapB family antitoxin [Intrasporangium sp.]|jgi:antitoxin VapB|uniref:type II toxin-antitoxin system VapB family antitoxin n=1 Tax=Intrasporangium sp. TaxID=1925024 RepID=UPI003365AC36